jgi:hypothetical protein
MMRRLVLTAERTMIRQGHLTQVPATRSDGLDPNPRNKRTMPMGPFGGKHASTIREGRRRTPAARKGRFNGSASILC